MVATAIQQVLVAAVGVILGAAAGFSAQLGLAARGLVALVVRGVADRF